MSTGCAPLYFKQSSAVGNYGKAVISTNGIKDGILRIKYVEYNTDIGGNVINLYDLEDFLIFCFFHI